MARMNLKRSQAVGGRRARNVAPALLTAFGLIHPVLARDLTEQDKEDIREAVGQMVGGASSIFGIRAWWGQTPSESWVVSVLATVVPFEVRPGLCGMETFAIRRREGDPFFEFEGERIPRTEYWRPQPGDGCELANRADVPDTVSVWPTIPTTDVERIIDGADKLISLAIPRVRCDEPIMDRLFQPGSDLRLSEVSLTRQHRPEVGIVYSAFFHWAGTTSGPQILFSLTAAGFEVHRSCFMNTDPLYLEYLD